MDDSLRKTLIANATSNIGLATQYIGNLNLCDDIQHLSTEIEWILIELKCACSNLETYKSMLAEEYATKADTN